MTTTQNLNWNEKCLNWAFNNGHIRLVERYVILVCECEAILALDAAKQGNARVFKNFGDV